MKVNNKEVENNHWIPVCDSCIKSSDRKLEDVNEQISCDRCSNWADYIVLSDNYEHIYEA